MLTPIGLASPNGEEISVRILAPGTKKGENVRLPGSDLQQGERVMETGEAVGWGGGEIGVLGTVGRTEVSLPRTLLQRRLGVEPLLMFSVFLFFRSRFTESLASPSSRPALNSSTSRSRPPRRLPPLPLPPEAGLGSTTLTDQLSSPSSNRWVGRLSILESSRTSESLVSFLALTRRVVPDHSSRLS